MTAETVTAPVRASVVVPVFNPGAGFDELVASFDRQSLRTGQFEVLLCDDGSDQPTRDRLQEVARARPNVRVLTLAHTGWPGTPRNHGIDAARGEYVFFADQDDRLFDRALEQMCDYADRHSSDVVIGKVVGVGRSIPRQIFRQDIPRAVLGRDPILEMLTPHKLFRVSFLRDNGIRFPDGRVRLEDHLFVMRAYFRAETISVLASRPCYAWVKHGASASASRIDPDTYFPHLETVLDLVEANTEPGALRDTLLRHWYRGKILQRLEGRRLVRYPEAYRERFLDVVTPIARNRFGPGVEAGLAFPLRIRSALLRAGRREDLVRFGAFEAGLTCRAEATAVRWTRGGRIALTLDVRILRDQDDALVFDRRQAIDGADAARPARGPAIWQPPDELGPDFLPREALDAGRDLRRDRVEVLLRDGNDRTERRVPGRSSRRLTPARVTVDPVALFGRADRSPGGQLRVQVRHAGWSFDTPLRGDRAVVEALGRSPVLAGRRCELALRSDGTVELRRAWPGGGSVRDLAARVSRRAVPLARVAVPPRVRGALSRLRTRWNG